MELFQDPDQAGGGSDIVLDGFSQKPSPPSRFWTGLEVLTATLP